MKRNDYLWIMIKGTGLYLLLQALLALPDLINAGQMGVSFRNMYPKSDFSQVMPALLRHTTGMTLVLATVKVVLYALVGGYLLRKGETLLNWAGGSVDNSEERSSSSIEEIKSTVEEKQNLDRYLSQVSEQIETENRTS